MKKYLPIALILAFLVFCISQAFRETSHPDASPPPQSFPLIEQPDDITCGPTSAAMLLRHYGKEVDVPQVAGVCHTRWFTWGGENVGMTAPEFVAASLRHFGVPSRLKRVRFDGLKYFVSEGRYPVVLLRSGNTTWHYVVAIGYDKEKVTVADPSFGGRRQIPSQDFERAWSFSHDMHGNRCGITCPVCKGSGSYPGWVPCYLCRDGLIDPLKELLASAEVFPNTVVVPDKKKD